MTIRVYPAKATDLEPIVHVDLAEKVYRLLKRKIFAREFPPGAKLDLDLLATGLHVSRSPINKALVRLGEEGLVRIAPRHGTFINELTTREVAETWDVRLALELLTAEQGLPRVSGEDIAGLVAQLERLATLRDDAAEDYLQYVTLDREFHLRLVGIAQNRKLLQVYAGLHTDVINARLYFHGRPRPRAEVNDDHYRLLSAYKAGDLQAARAVLFDWHRGSKGELVHRIEELGGTV